MNATRKKLIAIDGNSLLFRAFFALPVSIATRSGQPTNAVYGFATMLFKLLKEESPDVVVAAWDRAAPTFRHEAFGDYKAHRAKIPAELPSQFPLAKELLNALGMASYEIDGFEADDILAKIAAEAPAAGYDVTIVTGDKDALQLVNDDVKVMTTRKGITDTVVYDEEAVRERFGVGPDRVPDYLGLKGDSSDNIPGVPGVGDKTAMELLTKYGSLDEIYLHIEEIGKPKLKESLVANEEQARMSRQLAVLQPDIPITIDFAAVESTSADINLAKDILGKLEFKTLVNRLDDIDALKTDSLFSVADIKREISVPVPVILAIRDDVNRFRNCVLDESAFELTDTEPGVRIGVVCSDGAAFWGEIGDIAVTEYLAGSHCPKICHNLKDKARLLAEMESPLKNVVFDTVLAAYLLDPGRRSYEIADEASHYLGEEIPGGNEQQTVVGKAAALMKLATKTRELLAEAGLTELLRDIEMPLSLVLARMEAVGTTIDMDVLRGLSNEMAGKMNTLEGEIYDLAGIDFNLSSPQQLSAVLFEKMGLPALKKGKTGFSTDASVLTKLAKDHPIADKILSWRELSKLKSTYLDALPRLADPKTGRIHTYFNQIGTSTGRLASEKPNLQNIPVKGEWGGRIRAAFIPSSAGRKMMAADYSQIELRVLASLAGDKNMLEAFANGIDIHAATAAEVSGIGLDDVTPDLRRLAKAVNFGLVYGMGAYGLSERVGITPAEAEDYIAKYFERYPSIRGYIDSVIEAARRDGYVETVLGRRRYVRELASSDFNTRKQGERFAVNAVIQGSAADIIKIAMIRIDDDIRKRGLASRMFLQVHDELLFDVAADEMQTVIDMVKREMEGAYELRAGLSVNIGAGKSWGDIEK